jgi:Mn-dependent DtxR family transcriptional regulator
MPLSGLKHKMTFSEENYLKAIYHLTVSNSEVSTNAIAEMMETKAFSNGHAQEISRKI